MKHPARFFLVIGMASMVAVSTFFIFQPKQAEAGFSECIAAGLAGIGLGSVATLLSVPSADLAVSGTTGGSLAKDCILDGIGLAIREALIRKITSATVEWINGGFEGSPAFVTNMEDFLLDTADEAFGNWIYEDRNFAFLCSNIQLDVRFAIALSYAGRNSRPTCTLSSIVNNVENAVDNLSVEWDWDVYQTVTTDPSANPFLGLIQVSDDITSLLNEEQQQQLDDVNRGGGFLSFEHCRPAGSTQNTYEDNNGAVSTEGTDLSSSLGADRTGQECEVATPGSIVRQGLSDTLGSDLERLGFADEFDEIIGALMGQLFKQVFSGEGLSGVSQRSGSSRNFLAEYSRDGEGQAGEELEDLSSSIETYKQNATNRITIDTERIDRLTDARIQVESAYVCYESKYNTWVDQSGNVIAPSQVNSIPESNRSRATFAYLTNDPPAGAIYGGMVLGQTRVLLTPAVSLQKLQEIGAMLDRMDSDIAESEANIESSEQLLEDAISYEEQIENAATPSESLAIFQEFSRSIPAAVATTVDVQTSLQATIRYIEEILLGQISYGSGGQTRTGGANQELASCQLFSSVYSGN